MSKRYVIIIQFVFPLAMFYWSGAQRSDVYKRDVFVTSLRIHNHAWQPQHYNHLSETSRILWIHRRALTNQRCSLATGCGINALSASPTPDQDNPTLTPSHFNPMIYPQPTSILTGADHLTGLFMTSLINMLKSTGHKTPPCVFTGVHSEASPINTTLVFVHQGSQLTNSVRCP